MSAIAILILIVFYPCTPIACNGLKRRQIVISIIVVIRGPRWVVVIIHGLQGGHHFHLVNRIIALIRRVRNTLKLGH
jgi:hypothetical protein